MTEISTNMQTTIPQNLPQTNVLTKSSQILQRSKIETGHDKFWRREKRKDSGLIEKFYNAIKNVTGLGTGTKKVEKSLEKVKEGTISQADFKKTVHNYNSSQENAAQLFGDGLSMIASGFTFFGLSKAFKYSNAWTETNKPAIDKFKETLNQAKADINEKIEKGKNVKWHKWERRILNSFEKTINTVSSNKKLMIISTALAGLAGGITKYWTLKLNRTGSDEFKVDKKVFGEKRTRTPAAQKAAKLEKKRLNKERHKTNFKNFVSGTINGLMMPVLALGGAIGAPVYLIGNSLNRYFVANKSDKHKSAGGYIDNLTNDGITTAIYTAAAAVPLVKKGNYTKTFNENMSKVINKLKDAALKEPEYGGTSAYKKLETEILSSPKIKSIIDDKTISTDEQIRRLTQENLFAVKFKQISGDGTELARALKDKCPPTRTLEQAQEYINKNLGSGYKLDKLLGVGTVAETYFAKSPEGKEVCIKILKDGISKEKIEADKEKFVELVKNMKDKSQDEKDYLLRNVDDLADGIINEVNLQNEMDNAIKLAKTTKIANVVKPVEVKNNIYVMERATGVSLASFMDLNRLYIKREATEKLSGKEAKDAIAQIDKEIEAVQSRMPGFDDIKLRKEDTDFLLTEYQKVFIEQFHKVDKNGKIIHADIHPGNIFIDPEVLKTRKGKLFTLIDTGNMIDMGVEQSMRALNFSKYVQQGNVKDIAAFVLDGAKLPKGMSEKDAVDKVVKELETCFFDNKTKIEMLDDEKVLTLTDNIMQKYDIIPSSTQLNLNKSRTSARNSLNELQSAIIALDGIEVLEEIGKGNVTKGAVKGGMKGLEALAKDKIYSGMIKKQERENLKQLSPMEQLKQKKNPNAPKTNSEEYLTYKLKQYKIDEKTDFAES